MDYVYLIIKDVAYEGSDVVKVVPNLHIAKYWEKYFNKTDESMGVSYYYEKQFICNKSDFDFKKNLYRIIVNENKVIACENINSDIDDIELHEEWIGYTTTDRLDSYEVIGFFKNKEEAGNYTLDKAKKGENKK